MPTLYLLLLFLISSTIAAQNPQQFEPDQNLRKSIKNEVWKELEKHTPKNQMTYVAFSFLGKTPYSTYEKLAQREGLPHTDVATAQTFFKVVAWERLNDAVMDHAQREGLYRQTLTGLAKELANMTNAEKQQLADPYILKATWTNLTLSKAQNENDQVAMSAITSVVQQWFFDVSGKLITEVIAEMMGL